MILFYGDDRIKSVWIDGSIEFINENILRYAKLRHIQQTFNKKFSTSESDTTTHPFNIAQNDGLQNLEGDKSRLILNGHGNTRFFGANGKSGSVVAEDLLHAGLDESTREIWLLSCLTGIQRQDNKPVTPAFGNIRDNFGREFSSYLNQHTDQRVSVYAPRGWVTYRGIHWNHLGHNQRNIVIDEMVVTTKYWCDYGDGPKEVHGNLDKATYDFFEGMLLVHM